MVVLVAATTAALTTFTYHRLLLPRALPDHMTYETFVSLSLTGLGLMLAVLGFFVAAAGVIGWATFETKLKDHSYSYFKDQLSKDGELRNDLEKLFADIAYEGIENYKPKQAPDGETDYND